MSCRVCRGFLLICVGLRHLEGKLCEQHDQSPSPASADLATKGFRSLRFHGQQRHSAALRVSIDWTPLMVDHTFRRGEFSLRAVRICLSTSHEQPDCEPATLPPRARFPRIHLTQYQASPTARSTVPPPQTRHSHQPAPVPEARHLESPPYNRASACRTRAFATTNPVRYRPSGHPESSRRSSSHRRRGQSTLRSSLVP
jgi:hypothetical protein